MGKDKNLVRFDWAIKRLLRDKANFVILEGFLSTLLGRPIKILSLLESEGNRKHSRNKTNRVDLLAKDADGSHILIEVQNESESSYFHRMLFETSRIINDYLSEGERYDQIKKVYNINIVYFPLGSGKDYVYKGKTEFRGIHDNELLKLPGHMQVKYNAEEISDLFPEYYILRANDFNRWSKVPLDQWMYFLSTSTIPEDADAPGLKEAEEKLRVASLPIEEQHEYYEHIRAMNSWNEQMEDALDRGKYQGRIEGLEEGRKEGRKEGIKEGRREGIIEGKWELIKSMLQSGMTIDDVSRISKIPVKEIEDYLNS